MHPSFSQGKHSRFGTNRLAFGPTRIDHFFRNDVQINISQQIHFSRMNLHNGLSIFRIGIGKFNLAIDPSGTEQGGIQNVDAIRRHDDLDVLRGFKAVELIEQFQHGPLDFGIATAIAARRSDGIDFVHEYNGGRRFSCHDEQFAHHATAFSNVLLHQFGSRDADEGAIGVVGHGASEQRLARSGRAVQQDSLGLRDSQTFKEFGMLNGKFNDFLNFHDLFFQTPNHVVGGIGYGFDLHQAHERIDLGGKDLVQSVRIVAKCHTRIGFERMNVNILVQIDDVLSLGINFDQHLGLSHLFHHFSHVTPRLLQVVELFAQHAHLGIQLIATSLEALQIGKAFLDSLTQFSYFGGIVLAHAAIGRRGENNGRHFVVRLFGC
mmetsp:Transcript_2966/g.5482  ORF Transcript_2966/g.5482 Transcript_2966/m.5482 type:complete len:378 (-) Transcript_2966:7-1140(-)